jgi:hypothetical protein
MTDLLATIVVLLLFIWWVGDTKFDSTDDVANRERSSLSIRTDHLTGCEYLVSFLGGPTPRVAADGTHMGCKEI